MEQQYYTSSPRNIDGHAGFGIKAQSAAMPPDAAATLASYARYGKPHNASDEDIAGMPVAFSFYRVSDSAWAITRIVYTGQDYTRIRSGNFFGHSVLLDEADLSAIAHSPIRYFHAKVWRSEDPSDSNVLPPVSDLGTPSRPLDSELTNFLADRDRKRHLRSMIDALVGYETSKRRIILVDTPANVLLWFHALNSALPETLRSEFTFSTYQRDPAALNFLVTATCLDGDFHFSQAQYDFQYWIYNFEGGRFSPSRDVGPAAEYIADALASGGADELEELSRLAKGFGVRNFAELNALVTVRKPVYSGILPEDPSEIEAIKNFLRGAAASRREFAAEAAIGLAGAGVRENALEFLRQLLPVAFEIADPASARRLCLQCVEHLRARLGHRGSDAVFKLYADIGRGYPPLFEAMADGLEAQDWTLFLDSPTTLEPSVDAALPLLRESGLYLGVLPVWRALAGWSDRMGNAWFFDELKGLLRDPTEERIRLCRVCLGGCGDWMQASALSEQVVVGCRLLATVFRQGKPWEDDSLRLSDPILESRNPDVLVDTVVSELADTPEPLLRTLADVLAEKPAVVDVAYAGLQASLGEGFSPFIVECARLAERQPALRGLVQRAVAPSSPFLAPLIVAAARVNPPTPEGETLLDEALKSYGANHRPRTEVERMIAGTPELCRNRRRFSDLVLMALVDSGEILSIGEPSHLAMVTEALQAGHVRIGREDAQRIALCLKLTEAKLLLAKPFSTTEIRQTFSLQGIDWAYVPEPMYVGYLDKVFEGIRKSPNAEVAKQRIGEIAEGLVVERYFEPFVEVYLNELKGLLRKSDSRTRAVMYVVERVIPSFSREQMFVPAMSKLLGLLSKAEAEDLRAYLDSIAKKEWALDKYWDRCTERKWGFLGR